MRCLHCGDCCKRMSPLGNPCPHIIEEGTFVFCGIYNSRPQQCRDHSFPVSKCPIGVDVLRISDLETYRIRVDTAYEYLKLWDVATRKESHE